MRYDPLGFPIPPDFDRSGSANPADGPGPRLRPTVPGRGKRLLVAGLLLAAIVSGIVMPVLLPTVREVVVRWSVQRALDCEARGQSAAAIGAVGRAVAWSGADSHLEMELLCWRAMLRLETRDATGAGADAARAVDLAPTAIRPRRVRALVNVVLERADAALADAEAALELAGPNDPDALNHRAYVRALVGRDLEAALVDIDAALGDDPEGPPEYLDTRGYVLHLLGRHQEAIDLLNLAIATAEGRRREAEFRRRRGDEQEAARELRALDRDLAVMHRHRGLACRAVGLDGQAEQDLAIAEQKGYDPSRGVM